MIRALLIVAVLGALVILITTQLALANQVELAPGWYLVGPSA